MSDALTLSAETRERAGKGASRAHRREGRVPAVIYGQNQTPVSIHLEEKALVKALSNGHFMNTVVMIDLAGQPTRTLPKDVQFHPVSDRPLHVDFLRISEHATIHVAVPVRFVDEEDSPGLKRGAVLNVVRHELELICDAAEIPDEIVISLTGLDVGDSISHLGGHPADRRHLGDRGSRFHDRHRCRPVRAEERGRRRVRHLRHHAERSLISTPCRSRQGA